MGRRTVDNAFERLPRPRPGDELRAAQHQLEEQIGDLIARFGSTTGAWVAHIQVEYLQPPAKDGHRPADIVIRTSLET